MTVTEERPRVDEDSPEVESRPSLWIAIGMLVCLSMAVVGYVWRNVDTSPDTAPAAKPRTTAAARTWPANPQPREIVYPGYKVPSPAPSPTYVAPTWVGPLPLPAVTWQDVGGTLALDGSDWVGNTYTCGDPTPEPVRISDVDKARILKAYQLTPAQVIGWVTLLPTTLGGRADDPTNALPLTADPVVDEYGHTQTTLKAIHASWLYSDACGPKPTDRGVLEAHDVRAHLLEWTHWWGVGGYDDPAAASKWNPGWAGGYR